jgi:hypothetical protein
MSLSRYNSMSNGLYENDLTIGNEARNRDIPHSAQLFRTITTVHST